MRGLLDTAPPDALESASPSEEIWHHVASGSHMWNLQSQGIDELNQLSEVCFRTP